MPLTVPVAGTDTRAGQPDRRVRRALGCALAVELAALVYWTAFDGNEGWYALYPSMVLGGLRPYRDFFYHRLPLLPFVFALAAVLPVSRLLAIRILCGACAWLAWWFSAATAEAWTGTAKARTWVLVLALASLYGNSYLVTAQSYAPFALLVALGVWLMSSESAGRSRLRFACAGGAFAAAVGLRFGPDALLVVVPAAAVVGFFRPRSRANLLAVAAAFCVCVATIVAVGAWWDAGAFFWSVFVWPFKSSDYFAENGFRNAPEEFPSYVRMKAAFAIRAAQAYLPVVLTFLLASAAMVQRKLDVSDRRTNSGLSDVELLVPILVITEIVFFLLAADSGIMQYSFMLPVAAAWSVAFLCRATGTSIWERLSIPAAWAIAVAAALAGCTDQVRMSCSWRNPDVAALGAMGNTLRNAVGSDRYVVTFSPVLAAEANRQVYPGLEFEMFGFYPRWDDERAKRYRLLNWPMLKTAITSPRTGAVVLTSRWHDDVSMGRLLKPYRTEFAALLAESTDRVIEVPQPSCVGGVGPVEIHLRESHP